jgi:hypothetical protein
MYKVQRRGQHDDRRRRDDGGELKVVMDPVGWTETVERGEPI